MRMPQGTIRTSIGTRTTHFCRAGPNRGALWDPHDTFCRAGPNRGAVGFLTRLPLKWRMTKESRPLQATAIPCRFVCMCDCTINTSGPSQRKRTKSSSASMLDCSNRLFRYSWQLWHYWLVDRLSSGALFSSRLVVVVVISLFWLFFYLSLMQLQKFVLQQLPRHGTLFLPIRQGLCH